MRSHGVTLFFVALAASSAACGGAPDTSPSRTAQGLTGAPSFEVDIHQTSASGLSSGAFMAVQFHVAFSSIMKGAAAFAGGPFYCARGTLGDATGRCMSGLGTLDIAPSIKATEDYEEAGAIDAVSNLGAQNVFLFGGADDHTVSPAVMDGLAAYYAKYVTTGQVTYVSRRPATAHTMPTEDYGVDCKITTTPYIGKCGYDGAGEALRAIYGALAPRAGAPAGKIVPIRQGDFIANPAAHSLAETAYLYVPPSCAAREPCKIHVAFHGCLQNAAGAVGSQFYEHAGYNAWADTNHILVLYPQTVQKSGSNPNACWDWFGYDSPGYATKNGPQMAMVRAMVDRIATGAIDAAPAGPSDPPGGGPVTAPGGACFAASNMEHVRAGRAYVAFGWVFARGSNQPLGLYGPFGESSVAEVFPGFFVVGRCF